MDQKLKYLKLLIPHTTSIWCWNVLWSDLWKWVCYCRNSYQTGLKRNYRSVHPASLSLPASLTLAFILTPLTNNGQHLAPRHSTGLGKLPPKAVRLHYRMTSFI